MGITELCIRRTRAPTLTYPRARAHTSTRAYIQWSFAVYAVVFIAHGIANTCLRTSNCLEYKIYFGWGDVLSV